ncbi:MAG: SET domain-containing protein-lysine N-methyltransferase [Verrucomicrobiota bacterium]
MPDSIQITNLWEIRPSPIHGSGMFARTALPEGARIVEYVGRLISKTESLEACRQNNEAIFYWNEEFDLDGNVEWNPARHINHSCAPNCAAELVESRIWIVALRPIQRGEEITFNYGYDLQDYREHPCHCGASNCVGYILAEAFHPSLSNQKHRAP